MIITQEVHLFRETARHLWNTYLREDADFDTVDVFRNICRTLFCEKIVSRLGINAPPIPDLWRLSSAIQNISGSPGETSAFCEPRFASFRILGLPY